MAGLFPLVPPAVTVTADVGIDEEGTPEDIDTFVEWGVVVAVGVVFVVWVDTAVLRRTVAAGTVA